MFSHATVGITDFERALRFYRAVLPLLGVEERLCDPQKPWALWQPAGGGRPLFGIMKPFDGEPHQVGNGQMVAFAASSRAQVREVYEAAMRAGGSCEGPPGLRPRYHANYYGAYFRDTEGNKLCVVCHAVEA